ncbi:MAG: NUDIX domain-containing protein [Pirellulaceae bacterium]
MEPALILDIATAAGTWFAVGVSFFLVQMALRQWKADALDRLHERLIEPQLQDALRTIFAAKPDEFLDAADLRLRDAAEKVLNLYDLIGHRAKAETIPKQELIETEWPVILRVAQQVYLFIEAQKNARKSPYKEGFIWLVREIRGTDPIVEQLKRENSHSPQHPWTRLPVLPVHGMPGYRNSRPCVAVFICWNKCKVLFLERARAPGGWETPGGFLNDGEDPEAGAVREVAEETGFAMDSLRLIDIHVGDYSGSTGTYNTLNLCYLADVVTTLTDTPPVPQLDPAESKGFDWHPACGSVADLLAAKRLAFPWVADAYAKICSMVTSGSR